ncbi:MFS transporter [Singulisphaera sp. PoT]|uniref:MFS transporter n=1 Tax=Singulisphaera sp. PoT TaxID=3411797 RepID=UPI003BF6103F
MASIEANAGKTLATGRTPGWAWGICWLMFASTVLNYMDRQAMALVGVKVKAEFHLLNEGYGWVLASFALTYALFQVPAGYIVDRVNVRTAYALAVTWWSLAGIASAFAPSLAGLMIFRALLGVGESFNWPCALRTTALILPPSDRSLGNGIFNSGAAVGAVLTPVIVTLLTAQFGWRAAFVCVGTLGFVWVGVWLFILGGERQSLLAGRASPRLAIDDEFGLGKPRLSGLARSAFGGVAALSVMIALSAIRYGLPALWWSVATLMIGLLLIALLLPSQSLKGADWALSLGEVVRQRNFWIMVAVSICINVCWHFLANWLPSYLLDDRELTSLVALMAKFQQMVPTLKGDAKYLASGLLSAVPFIAADIGNLGGGACSRYVASRGVPASRSRMLVMASCTILIGGGALVGAIRNDLVAMILLALMALGTAAYMANYFTFTQEVAPKHTGLVVGILGGLGNLFAAGILPYVGRVKDVTGSFAPLFVLVGLLPFVGTTILVLGWRSRPSSPEAVEVA